MLYDNHPGINSVILGDAFNDIAHIIDRDFIAARRGECCPQCAFQKFRFGVRGGYIAIIAYALDVVMQNDFYGVVVHPARVNAVIAEFVDNFGVGEIAGKAHV